MATLRSYFKPSDHYLKPSMKQLLCIILLLFLLSGVYAQKTPLNDSNLIPNKVRMRTEKWQGATVVKVVKDASVQEADEPTFVSIKNVTLQNGIIEVDVLSRLLPTATANDRGFIGVAFRINDNNTKFECIYLRPTNGRAEDQLRRNHSIQYFSYPDFKFTRLRKESPEKYESYADMTLNRWIKLRIVIKGSQAKLFLDNNTQPALIVNDLKHGADAFGAIGFFVDVGTEGYFKNLKVTPFN